MLPAKFKSLFCSAQECGHALLLSPPPGGLELRRSDD